MPFVSSKQFGGDRFGAVGRFGAGRFGEAVAHKIGDLYGGGIVAYVATPAEIAGGLKKYLIAAVSDQSTGTAWSNITDVLVSGTSTALGAGEGNTDKIIAKGGHTASAAAICRAYTAGGFVWSLPSKDELKKLWDVRAIIGGFIAGQGFWSSTEGAATTASELFASSGLTANSPKTGSSRVRAIRWSN